MTKRKSDRKRNQKKKQKRNKKRRHDNFFRTVFSNPKYARKLLQLAAKRNKRLRQFLSLVKISTLRQIPGDAPREGLGGCADVAFHVKLARSKAELLVGIVLEHKSFPDSNIRYQLLGMPCPSRILAIPSIFKKWVCPLRWSSLTLATRFR